MIKIFSNKLAIILIAIIIFLILAGIIVYNNKDTFIPQGFLGASVNKQKIEELEKKRNEEKNRFSGIEVVSNDKLFKK